MNRFNTCLITRLFGTFTIIGLLAGCLPAPPLPPPPPIIIVPDDDTRDNRSDRYKRDTQRRTY